MRLDLYISTLHPKITRSQIKRLIESGCVKIAGAVCEKPAQKVRGNEKIEVDIPPPEKTEIIPEDIKLNILYEDSDIIVINKSPDMVVHPAVGNKSGTLVNALLGHCKDLSGIGGELKPGIVHRLDKGTSGVIVAAKNDKSHLALSKQFKDRGVKKIYRAIVFGKLPNDEGMIDEPIGRHVTHRKKMSTKTKKGRIARTGYKVLKRFGNELTYVEIQLMTGRTHQIRVHMSAIGHPLVGDETYGGVNAIKRLKDKELVEIVKVISRPALHAYKLGFQHPGTGEMVEFEAPIAPDFSSLLEQLKLWIS